MRRTDLLGSVLFTVASIVSASVSADDSTRPDEYRVSEIRARSYYPARGEFDERDLFDPTLVLRNVIIGEGDARDPTKITLVLVTVDGPSFTAGTKGSVELNAQAIGASPANQSIPFWSLFSERTRVTVPFLIHGTGCEPLALEARITGVAGDPPAPKKATIPFHCGE